MSFRVYLIFEGSNREFVEERADLHEACRVAFDLADDFGQQQTEDAGGLLIKVSIYRGEVLEISIEIKRDGLLGHKAAPILRAM